MESSMQKYSGYVLVNNLGMYLKSDNIHIDGSNELTFTTISKDAHIFGNIERTEYLAELFELSRRSIEINIVVRSIEDESGEEIFY